MRSLIVFCLFGLAITVTCFAQTNQTKSLTITTYYPAPYAVYSKLQLSPGEQPALTGAGIMYFNNTEQKPYISNDTQWQPMFSGSSSITSQAGYHIAPDQCSGNKNTGAHANQLCDGLWFKDIVFPQPFPSAPHVIVTAEAIPDVINSPCTRNVTDMYIAYPENITPTGFRLFASGSVEDYQIAITCGAGYENWYTRATAGWYAVTDTQDGNFTVGSVWVCSPDGGEVWDVGSTHNITWDTNGTIDAVRIEYSTDNGTTYTPITWATRNNDTYSWNVTNTPSTTCLIKILDSSDHDVNDTSDAAFTIQ